jgi:hypothetical protein
MELMTVAVDGFLATKQDESHGWSYLGWQMDCISQNMFPTLLLFEHKNSLLDLFTYVCACL